MLQSIMLIAILFALAALTYRLFFSSTSQVFGRVFAGKKTSEKIIALSFDDGPNEPFTSQLLDVLARHGVKAAFFVVGENAERFPETVKRISREGHAVGNHLYRHSFLTSLRPQVFREEMAKTQAVLSRLAGKRPTLFRPPWLFRHPALLKAARDEGLTTVTGTFGSLREVFQAWNVLGINAEKIMRDALRRAHPGAVLIFHDGYDSKRASRKSTVDTIALLIPRLLENGYRFATLLELMVFLGAAPARPA